MVAMFLRTEFLGVYVAMIVAAAGLVTELLRKNRDFARRLAMG